MRCTQHPAARRLAEVYAVSRNRRQGRVSDCLRVIDCSGKEKALPRAARRALRDADRASSSARGGRQLRHLDVHVRAALRARLGPARAARLDLRHGRRRRLHPGPVSFCSALRVHGARKAAHEAQWAPVADPCPSCSRVEPTSAPWSRTLRRTGASPAGPPGLRGRGSDLLMAARPVSSGSAAPGPAAQTFSGAATAAARVRGPGSTRGAPPACGA